MGDVSFSQTKPKRQTLHPKHGFFSQLRELKERPAAYSWRLPPRPRKADEEGFQGGVWTDRLCPAAGWPEEKLAGDVVQL